MQPEDPPSSFFTGLGIAQEGVWDAPETTHRDRKRLLACLAEEVTLQVVADDRTEVVIHWRGGRADSFWVKRQKRRPIRRRDDIDTVEPVRQLAQLYPEVQFVKSSSKLTLRQSKLWQEGSRRKEVHERNGNLATQSCG